jgi:NAD(P)-dependent dehydrogenase (short-subunit alcohol dehydrogenase family)
MGRLQGKVAIITGAAYGIGLAAAERFAKEGASVMITDVKGHEEAAAKLAVAGLDVTPFLMDVTDDKSVDAGIAEAIGKYGRIDILVNNAAISAGLKPAPFEQADPAEWQRVWDVNVLGVFRTCRAVSPHMRAAQSGKIINVASGTAFKGHAGLLHYVASKGAVITMTRSLANEFGKDNIQVNCVSPGFTLTESVQAVPDVMTTYSVAAVTSRFIKRDAYALDVANVMYFLASDDSNFVTGQTIAADGGSVMH